MNNGSNIKQNDSKDIKYFIRRVESLLEVGLLSLIYFLMWKYNYRDQGPFPYYGRGKYILVGVYAIFIFILFYYSDSFKFGYLKAADAVMGQYIALIIVNVVTYFQLCLISNFMLNVVPMLILTLIDIATATCLVYLFTAIYHHFYVPKDMLMIYGTKQAVALKIKMNVRTDKYDVSKMMSCDEDMELLQDEMMKHDAVIINDVHAEKRNDLLKFCYKNKIRAYIVPKISDIILQGAEEITLFDTPLLLVKGNGPTLIQLMVKRMVDIILCLIAMIPGLPIMLIVAAAIKLEDGGPVFYKQERVTKDERRFNILKFRSMIVDAEKAGISMPAVDHDPRITKVGNVIRGLRIDELPQILNILKGDMSIVGPRPERVEHHLSYTEEVPEFVNRTKVKGGLTGYAQIYGKYNTSPYDKLRLDLMYIENYSIMLDFKLILMTLQILFKPESTEGFDKVIEVDEEGEEITDNKTED